MYMAWCLTLYHNAIYSWALSISNIALHCCHIRLLAVLSDHFIHTTIFPPYIRW